MHVLSVHCFVLQGTWKDVTWADNWTSVTQVSCCELMNKYGFSSYLLTIVEYQDGRRSAQFEHTMLVTECGVEVLTARTEKSVPLFWDGETIGRCLICLFHVIVYIYISSYVPSLRLQKKVVYA